MAQPSVLDTPDLFCAPVSSDLLIAVVVQIRAICVRSDWRLTLPVLARFCRCACAL
jgi:hypothetical protein